MVLIGGLGVTRRFLSAIGLGSGAASARLLLLTSRPHQRTRVTNVPIQKGCVFHASGYLPLVKGLSYSLLG